MAKKNKGVIFEKLLQTRFGRYEGYEIALGGNKEGEKAFITMAKIPVSTYDSVDLLLSSNDIKNFKVELSEHKNNRSHFRTVNNTLDTLTAIANFKAEDSILKYKLHQNEGSEGVQISLGTRDLNQQLCLRLLRVRLAELGFINDEIELKEVQRRKKHWFEIQKEKFWALKLTKEQYKALQEREILDLPSEPGGVDMVALGQPELALLSSEEALSEEEALEEEEAVAEEISVEEEEAVVEEAAAPEENKVERSQGISSALPPPSDPALSAAVQRSSGLINLNQIKTFVEEKASWRWTEPTAQSSAMITIPSGGSSPGFFGRRSADKTITVSKNKLSTSNAFGELAEVAETMKSAPLEGSAKPVLGFELSNAKNDVKILAEAAKKLIDKGLYITVRPRGGSDLNVAAVLAQAGKNAEGILYADKHKEILLSIAKAGVRPAGPGAGA